MSSSMVIPPGNPPDIIDYVTNNWSQILGMPNGGAPSPPPAPPPSPPTDQGFSPSGVADINPLTGTPRQAPMAPMPGAGAPPSPVMEPPPSPQFDASSGLGPMAGPIPPQAGGSFGGGSPSQQPTLTPPPPMAPTPQAGAPALQNNIPTSTGPTPPPNNIQFQPGNFGLATNPATPPPPPMAPGTAPPTATTGGGLTSALANNNARPPWQNALTAGLAGLGRGMSQVGQMRPGTPAAQAFAAGAGGGLEGGINHIQQEQQQNFQRASLAFKDMMLAKQQESAAALSKAHADYFSAYANIMNTSGNRTGTSSAWQGTPFGKTIQVENETNKLANQLSINRRAAATRNAWTPEQEQEQKDKDDKQIAQYRGNLYKRAGMTPEQGDAMKDLGTSQDKPIPTTGIRSAQDFNNTILPGQWYDSGNKFGPDGTYTVRMSDGSQGPTLTGKPGAAVVLQRVTPQQEPQASPQQPVAQPSQTDLQTPESAMIQ